MSQSLLDPTSTASVTATVLRGDPGIIDQVESAWDGLCRLPSTEGPFATPAWVRAWLCAFTHGSLILIVLQCEGQIVGIAPFIETLFGIGPLSRPILSTIANDYVDRTAFVLDPAFRDRAMPVLFLTLQQMKYPIVSLRTVPKGGSMDLLADTAAAAGHAVVRRTTHRMPYLAYNANDDVTQFGPWKNIRRYRRKLQEPGTYEARTTRPATLASLQRFFDVETESWKGEAGTDAGGNEASAAFYRQLITAPDPSCTTVTNEIIVDGKTIAASFGIDMHGVYYYLKGSYLPEYRSYGVGHINLQEILVSQKPHGTHEIDFLGTDDAYKLRWTDAIRPHDHVLILPRGPVGKLAHPLIERGIPLARNLKTRLRRGKTVTHD